MWCVCVLSVVYGEEHAREAVKETNRERDRAKEQRASILCVRSQKVNAEKKLYVFSVCLLFCSVCCCCVVVAVWLSELS